MNNSNILNLASVCRNLARGFCGVKNNVFFLFPCEHILFKKQGLVVYLLFTGYAIKMTNADYEDNTIYLFIYLVIYLFIYLFISIFPEINKYKQLNKNKL